MFDGMVTQFPNEKQFILYLLEERSIKVNSSITSAFRLITTYFSCREFTKENIRIFLHTLRTTGELTGMPLKASTVNKYIRVIRLIASYMGRRDIESFHGYRIMERDTKPLGDMLTDREMRDICHVNRKHERMERDTNLRFRAALTLMRFSGMPPVDLCNLTWDMDRQTHFEFYRQKTGKHMIVPIVPELRRLLDRMERRPHNFVFGSFSGRMKPQSLNAEIHERVKILNIKKHVTAYSFRYSMITHCYINGGEGVLPKIAKISGHTLNTALKHYAKYDVQTLADALHASHPGLIRQNNIDTIKRNVLSLVYRLIDKNKFEIDLVIRLKERNIRHLRLS